MNWSLSFLIQENQCSKNPCPLNNNCQNGFGDKGYRCHCHTGYTGEACDQCKKRIFTLICYVPEGPMGKL